MRFRVVANRMPALRNLPREGRKRPHALPNQKKCSRCVESFKKLQHYGRDSRIRPIIKSNSHARRIIQSSQSRPENLRTRRHSPPSEQPTRRAHPACPKPCWVNRHPTSNFRTRPRRLPTNVEFLESRPRTLGFRNPFCYDAPVRSHKMPTTSPPRQKIPDWFRWLALLSLVLWFAAYWHAWGPANFLHLCDIAVILTCIGLWTNNALLVSSQAVSSVLIDIVWTLDLAARLIFGRHLIGGTEYLFDATTPLWARLLSLFHIVLPFILLWSLSRLGYDRRAWKLQSAILLLVLIASRFVTPDQNLNFAVKDPFLHRSYGPAPTHLAITFLFLAFVVYFPTHLLLRRVFSPPPHEVRDEQKQT
jgi:hypothetical protein